MVIPLTNEEYFDNEVCMNCYTVIEYPTFLHLPSHEVLELCGSCSFGLFQCSQCGHITTHLNDTPYREMVYMGPQNTFDDHYIFCRECADNRQFIERSDNEEESEYETDTEQEFDICESDTQTQILC